MAACHLLLYRHDCMANLCETRTIQKERVEGDGDKEVIPEMMWMEAEAEVEVEVEKRKE